MTHRTYIFIAILGVSFVGMLLYLNSWTGLSSQELTISILFGVVLVAIPMVFAKKAPNNLPGIPRSGFFRHYFIGLAMVFAAWMLLSVILLPLYGTVGFDILENPLFGFMWAGLGVVAVPLARKFIR